MEGNHSAAQDPESRLAVLRTEHRDLDSAIEALGMLNKSLTDISQGRGGGSAMLGLLGIAALVGFISGRKR